MNEMLRQAIDTARASIEAKSPEARHKLTALRSAMLSGNDPMLFREQSRALDSAIVAARTSRWGDVRRAFNQAERLGFGLPRKEQAGDGDMG